MSEKQVNRNRKLLSGSNALLMVLGIAGLLVGLNWFGATTYARADMTDDQLNSLSATSIDAVQSMEGLELRLYRSKRLPKSLEGPRVLIENVPLFIQQLEDKLDEYKRASNGNVSIAVVNDDLESQAGALNLVPLKIPSDKSEDAEPDALNKRYYIALSLHYGTVEEVVRVMSNPGTFEYDITKALLRLRAKQADSAVQRDLIVSGKELNERVGDCVKAIEKLNLDADKAEEELEGGLVEQAQSAQNDVASQVAAYVQNLELLDKACGSVTATLKEQRTKLEKAKSDDPRRALSREHYDRLLTRIGWFDGLYGAWVATLIGQTMQATGPGQQPAAQGLKPALLNRLTLLMDHPEVPARTTAIRVLGGMLRGTPQSPGLQGPPAQLAGQALTKGLKDSDPVVRAVAVEALAAAAGEQAVGHIQAALNDPAPTVREVALDLVLRMKLNVENAAVIPFLKDENWQVRRMAIAVLMETGGTAELFRPLLDDRNREVQFLAAYALARLRDTSSAPKLRTILMSLPAGQARSVLQAELDAMPGAAPEPSDVPAPAGGEAPAAGSENTLQPTPNPAPPGGPGAAHTPGAPAAQAPPGGGLRQALGRAGLDRLGDVQMPSPLEGVKVLANLKDEINALYTTLKDSPGRKSIGFYCGHEEFCPFAEKDTKIPDEIVQAFAQQPFTKKAIDDIKNLESRLNEQNEGIRNYFLSAGYRLIEVKAGQPVPPEVDALFVYGPRQPFNEIDLYDLDQFILTGKPVVIMLNNYDILVNQWDDKPPYNLTSKIQSTNLNLDGFLAHYGVTNNKDLVMETEKGLYERINTINIEMSNIGPLPLAAKYSYPLFPTFEYFSETDPLVAGMRRVTLPFASSMSPSNTGDPALTFEPLIQSSVTSVNRSKDFVIDPKALKDELFAWPVNGPHTVAAHITGEGVSSFFAGKQRPERLIPPTEDGQEAPKEEPKEADQRDKGQVNLVIIGSNLGFESIAPSRLIADFNLTEIAKEKVTGLGAAIPYYIRFVNTWGRFVGYQNPIHLGERGNVAQLPGQQVDFFRKSVEFLFGVFDWATGDVGLAQIRAKGDTDRPLKASENQRAQVTYGLVFGLPILVILLGLLRFSMRRMGRNRLGTGA